MVTDTNGLITLPALAKEAGITTMALWSATNEGLITPAGRKRHNTMAFSREDAILVIFVAGLAIAAGVAFVTVLRVIKVNGGTLKGGAIKIPVPTTININT